ncbi:hypothetical protein [Methylophaga sp.]|uniref:hypothetical protein n=1 Tax=Methylophaga sp. TaxID=2024840 RepID=UPI003A90CBE0
MVREYLSTKDLCQRFRCSSRTIFRRMTREENPFPQPLIRQAGSFNLWCADAVKEWEALEIERSENSRWGGINASPPVAVEKPARRWH